MILGDYPRNVEVDIGYQLNESRLYSDEWFQVSNGDWQTIDLGAETDKRYVDILTRGPVEEMRELEVYLKEITLLGGTPFSATIEEGEDVFGCEIDYTNPVQALVVGEPKFIYESLDWAIVEFKLLLDPSFSLVFKPQSGSFDWSTIQWEFGAERVHETNKKLIVTYTGQPDYVYDEMSSIRVPQSFSLQKNEAVWLKLELLAQRTNEFTIPNPYYQMNFGLSQDPTIDVKVMEFSEVRETRNLYRIDLEFLING